MYTEAKYQYQADSQKPIKFVLPPNLEHKYRQYNEQTQQLLKSTQKCPFTSIRQLIIAFKANHTRSTDLQKSDILRQKYQENNKFKQIDEELNNLIQANQLSEARSLKLLQCVHQYNQLYENCLLNARSFVPPERPFASVFGAPLIPQNKTNRSYLQKQSNYFHFLTYSNELERALVLGNISHPQLFKNQSGSLPGVNNFRAFYDSNYNKIKTQISRNSQNLLSLIFDWRMRVKQGGADTHLIQDELKHLGQSMRNIDRLIGTIQNFNEWLGKDRQTARGKYESDSRDYKRFLPSYKNEKQRHQITQNQSFLNLIVKEQKIKLQDHLKKNYCVIVNYIPSDEYTKVITPIKDNESFRDLLRIQIQPLQLAFNYINRQYQQLYRDACQGRDPSKLRTNISNNIRKFNGFLENGQNPYFIHLINSCERLLQIVR